MGTVIDHSVSDGGEPRLEVLFERIASMVRPDGDDRHTGTIPIVARGVKRPYISGNGLTVTKPRRRRPPERRTSRARHRPPPRRRDDPGPARARPRGSRPASRASPDVVA